MPEVFGLVAMASQSGCRLHFAVGVDGMKLVIVTIRADGSVWAVDSLWADPRGREHLSVVAIGNTFVWVSWKFKGGNSHIARFTLVLIDTPVAALNDPFFNVPNLLGAASQCDYTDPNANGCYSIPASFGQIWTLADGGNSKVLLGGAKDGQGKVWRMISSSGNLDSSFGTDGIFTVTLGFTAERKVVDLLRLGSGEIIYTVWAKHVGGFDTGWVNSLDADASGDGMLGIKVWWPDPLRAVPLFATELPDGTILVEGYEVRKDFITIAGVDPNLIDPSTIFGNYTGTNASFPFRVATAYYPNGTMVSSFGRNQTGVIRAALFDAGLPRRAVQSADPKHLLFTKSRPSFGSIQRMALEPTPLPLCSFPAPCFCQEYDSLGECRKVEYAALDGLIIVGSS